MSIDDDMRVAAPDPRAHGPRVQVTCHPYVDVTGELVSIGVASTGVVVVVRNERNEAQVFQLGGSFFMRYIE